MQLDITEHSKMTAALEDDPFLTGLRQREAEFLFGLAIGNQKQSGYSVLEVGCGAGAFTKQVQPCTNIIAFLAGCQRHLCCLSAACTLPSAIMPAPLQTQLQCQDDLSRISTEVD